MDFDEKDLVRRAMAAWFRSGNPEIPSRRSRVVDHLGKRYVVLENSKEIHCIYENRPILGVYRVRGDGFIKALRRWPSEIEQI